MYLVAVLKTAKLLNELALNKCQTMPDNLLPYRNWFSSPYIPTRGQIMPSALLLACGARDMFLLKSLGVYTYKAF